MVENNIETEPDIDEFMDCVDHMEELETVHKEEETKLIISLHVMLGMDGYQTMRIQSKIKNQRVIFLVDIKSTHNFVNHSVTKRIGVSFQGLSGMFVLVANGE